MRTAAALVTLTLASCVPTEEVVAPAAPAAGITEAPPPRPAGTPHPDLRLDFDRFAAKHFRDEHDTYTRQIKDIQRDEAFLERTVREVEAGIGWRDAANIQELDERLRLRHAAFERLRARLERLVRDKRWELGERR